jgi:SAM-dependent methyltransferase
LPGAWYEEAFRGDYLRVYPHRDDASAAAEAAAWSGRLPGLAPGLRVLDLACGAGRHLRALAAMGARAAGCDLSADLLAGARAAGCRCIIRCDMRRLPFLDRSFDAVTCFFSSFGYFPGEDEDAAVLREVARVLRPGGGMLLDLMDPETVRAGLVPRSERSSGGASVLEERSLSGGGRRVEKRVTLREGGEVRRWTESVRLYDPAEAEALAVRAGFLPAGRFGGHGVAPWEGGRTPRCILLLRRAA